MTNKMQEGWANSMSDLMAENQRLLAALQGLVDAVFGGYWVTIGLGPGHREYTGLEDAAKHARTLLKKKEV